MPYLHNKIGSMEGLLTTQEVPNLHDLCGEYWSYRGVEPKTGSLISQLSSGTLLGNSIDDSTLFGLELEMEQVQIKYSDTALTGHHEEGLLPPHWFQHSDGSLRNGVEFVTSPLRFRDQIIALANLSEFFRFYTNSPSFSWRTSDHVHMNVRDLTWEQLAKLIVLYSVFENQMFNFADIKRRKSVFCVPLIQTRMSENVNYLLGGHGSQQLSRSRGWDKYCALGTYRLYDLGTLEFRHLPGTFDIPRILTWMEFILCLKRAAIKMSLDEIHGHLINLNTVSNYHEFQSMIFGYKLCNVLGYPPNAAQMLSNGVTFAKKCLAPETHIEPSTEDCGIMKLRKRLNTQIQKQYEDHAAKQAAKPKRAPQSFEQALAELQNQAMQNIQAANQPAMPLPPPLPQFHLNTNFAAGHYTIMDWITEEPSEQPE